MENKNILISKVPADRSDEIPLYRLWVRWRLLNVYFCGCLFSADSEGSVLDFGLEA